MSRSVRGLLLVTLCVVLVAPLCASPVVADAAVPAADAGTDETSGPVFDVPADGVAQTETSGTDSTLFERIETDSTGMTIRLNTSLLASGFAQDSVFRLVVGGTALDKRVVWFDIGIGYTGGSLLGDPTDGFVVRSELSMSVPGV